MTWDDNFAPAARGTFDAIANEMKSAKLVNLTVLPTPAEGAIQVDGRPVQLIDGHIGLTPGEHLLQIGQSPVATFTMTLDGTENPTLVLPSLVGPEVLAGSTRLKSGTATKLVLNMVTTLAMTRLGKVHGNLMVDVVATANKKLWQRGIALVSRLTGLAHADAEALLRSAGGHVKTAAAMHRLGCDKPAAEAALRRADGFLRRLAH